eukprot:3795583-Amphidinium_carterae.1
MATIWGLPCIVALFYLLLLAGTVYSRGILSILRRRVNSDDCFALPQALCTHLPGVRVYYIAWPALWCGSRRIARRSRLRHRCGLNADYERGLGASGLLISRTYQLRQYEHALWMGTMQGAHTQLGMQCVIAAPAAWRDYVSDDLWTLRSRSQHDGQELCVEIGGVIQHEVQDHDSILGNAVHNCDPRGQQIDSVLHALNDCDSNPVSAVCCCDSGEQRLDSVRNAVDDCDCVQLCDSVSNAVDDCDSISGNAVCNCDSGGKRIDSVMNAVDDCDCDSISGNAVCNCDSGGKRIDSVMKAVDDCDSILDNDVCDGQQQRAYSVMRAVDDCDAYHILDNDECAKTGVKRSDSVMSAADDCAFTSGCAVYNSDLGGQRHSARVRQVHHWRRKITCATSARYSVRGLRQHAQGRTWKRRLSQIPK